jgi:hypothetical protein
MGYKRLLSAAIVSILIGIAAFPTHAGVQATSPDARLVFPTDLLPSALESGQWSMLVWVYTPHALREPSDLIHIGGRLAISADSTSVRVGVAHKDRSARLSIPAPLQAGRWHLLAVSVDVRQSRARAWLATETMYGIGGPIVSASAPLAPPISMTEPSGDPLIASAASASPSGPPAPLLSQRWPTGPAIGPPADGLVIGSVAGRLPAAILNYEALAFRDHPLNDADVTAVWQSRRYFAGHSLDTRDRGGRMTGWAGCSWLALHSVCTSANGSGVETERRSWVGGPVLTTNVPIMRVPRAADPSQRGAFTIVAPITAARGFVFRSRLEPGLDGFFVIDPPDFDVPEFPVGEVQGRVHELVTGPRGLLRVLVSGNSRGTRGSLRPQPFAENFAHGLIEALRPQVAGVMMRPAAVFDLRGGWAGFDSSLEVPPVELVRSLHARTDAWGTFTRFGSGTMVTASLAPGPATNISPTGVFRMRCEPIEGTLLRADAPMIVEAMVLAFPGSSRMTWAPEIAPRQGADGTIVGPTQETLLDTSRVTLQWGPADAMPTPTRMVLAQDVDARTGDAVVVMSGPNRGGVSLIESVARIGERTTIDFSRPLDPPTTGNELRIGPHRFVKVRHEFEPVQPGDDRQWRGLELRASGEGIGVMVYALSAWRPGVDGYVIGSAGQGGAGYDLQLDNAFPGALGDWVRASEVDVWIVGLAQQQSSPTSMDRYTAELLAALPDDGGVVWASDAIHGHSEHDFWHLYVAEHAAANGVAGVSGLSVAGSYLDQIASGMRADDAHYTVFGNTILARTWLEQLRMLVLGACTTADFDRSGAVDSYDVLTFHAAWTYGQRSADLDGDGRVTPDDYARFLQSYGECH